MDGRYKQMQCEKCGSTHKVFTILQSQDNDGSEITSWVTVSAKCECGEEVQLAKLCSGIRALPRYEETVN